MEFYVESVARAISGASLTKLSDPSAETSILLPQYSNGTADSDRIINAPEGFGLTGNDLLIVSEAGNFVLNGGIGEDTFVVSSYGANIRINGPADELEDALFFALDGTLTVETLGKSTIFKMTGKDSSQVSTVTVEHANDYDITLVGIIQTSEIAPWSVAVIPTTPPPAG
jgi:Ca2+-binding RTX toxin-like protein